MKFHCDRCNTRYSIADERVRGKILKIRCKSCSAVITVRETLEEEPTMAAPDYAAGNGGTGGSALHGAFRDVMTGGPELAAQPPSTLQEEWYLAVDGEQSGPFDLAEARDWIVSHHGEGELHCWNEDFDDWLPIEKVSHFRGLRGSGMSQLAPAAEETSKPRFAHTVQRNEERDRAAGGVSAMASASVDDVFAHVPRPVAASASGAQTAAAQESGPVGASTELSGPAAATALDYDDDLDLDIGEASRIVRLPDMLSTELKRAAEEDDEPEELLAGVARIPKAAAAAAVDRRSYASGAQTVHVPAELADEPAAPPGRRHSWVLLGAIGGAVLLLVGLTIFFTYAGEDEGETLTRSGRDRKLRSLGFQLDPITGKPIAKAPGTATEPTKQKRRGSKTRKSRQSRVATTGPATTSDPVTSTKQPDSNGSVGDPNRELTPTDVNRAARKGQYLTSRCYNWALKRDPFLKIKRMRVFIAVDKSGKVNSARAIGYSGYLAGCLTKHIRNWKFPPSRNGIRTEITLAFGQR